MKRTIYLLFPVVLAVACKKTKPLPPPLPPTPSLKYTNLGDSAIRMNRSAVFDLNGDREWDIFFGTVLVGDPLSQQDKRQWLLGSSLNTNLPVNDNERIPMMQKDQLIPVNSFSGYSWFNASMVYLTQKVIGMTAPPFWEGEWKNANHHFIPVQVNKNGSIFNGWVEVSFNMNEEKLILHKAAISLNAGAEIKAGG